MVKIMAAGACERLMPIYQIMKHDIAEDHNIKNNCYHNRMLCSVCYVYYVCACGYLTVVVLHGYLPQ